MTTNPANSSVNGKGAEPDRGTAPIGAILPDDLVEMKAAARLAKCHLATLYRWVLPRAGRQPRLRAWKRGGRYFVSKAELLGMFRPVETQTPVTVATGISAAVEQAWVEATLRAGGYRRPAG